jgi:diaminohydroxyphosphoribosylaminopyrimidine deaminase/5-amino-6-(5-phosphoribosylamino)uracil reductase
MLPQKKTMPDPATDAAWMRVALAEARKGIGLTSPNPPVGAAIVKDGRLLAKDHHRKAGGPHAEIEALRKLPSPSNARGATIYITLEPCSTTGHTPPCCEALIAAGLTRVVYATRDPNPAHAGRADSLLATAGISVIPGVLEADGAALLRPWAKWITTGVPWVIAKAGLSLDGRLTRPRGESQWLTSEAARADALRLRSEVDAILIGAETVRRDNPMLTLRGPGARRGKRQPWRVVVTKTGQLPENSHLFTDPHAERTLVFPNKPLKTVLRELGKRGLVSILVEGGGQILGEFFQRGLVDEACLYYAPIFCGESGVPALGAVLDRSISLAPDATLKKLAEGNFRLRGRLA